MAYLTPTNTPPSRGPCKGSSAWIRQNLRKPHIADAPSSRNNTHTRARLVSIKVSMNSMGVTPPTPRFPQGCITVLVTRPVTTETRNAWGCLRVRATLLSLWPQG